MSGIRLIGIAAALILGVAMPSAPGAQPPGAPDVVNTFPATKVVEAFRGTPVSVDIEFGIYFPVDDTRYVPITKELCERLDADPVVERHEAFRVRVIASHCAPSYFSIRDARGTAGVTGATITTRLEVVASGSALPGPHVIRLTYPVVDRAFRALGSKKYLPAATAQVEVQLWRSFAEKAEAARRAQAAQREQERQVMRVLTGVGAGVGLVGLVGLGLGARRKWIGPTVKVTLSPGGHLQQAGVMRMRNPLEIEPGTIVETGWARNRRGMRHRIKIEALVGDVTERKPKGLFSRAPKVPLDVLVSTGASVPEGRYSTRLRWGVVRVKISRLQ